MKRLLSLLMCVIMISSTTVFAENSEKDTLVVGSTTRMSGDFFAGLWSSNTADVDVQTLLHDANIIALLPDGEYGINPAVVANLQTEDHDNGERTYTFTLKDRLYFSDGTSITSKSYIFSVLLLSSKEIGELGAAFHRYAHLKGWDAFAGQTGPFEGVRLLNDASFSLTLKPGILPYFYEMALLEIMPYPMHVIAPGCTIKDDGNGAYIEGNFSKELLEKTILDHQTGYLSHPSAVSGPYALTSYDQQNSVAEFSLNPYYGGNFEGRKPSIPHIIFKEVKNETAAEELQNGTVDLINKVSEGNLLSWGIRQADEKVLGAESYTRSGFSFLAFACENELVSSADVRKAIALSIDKQALCDDFLQGYGLPVYGYYGCGQWMAQDMQNRLPEMDLYEKDIYAARQLLEKAGWIKNQKGNVYQENDGIRYCFRDQQLKPLSLKMAVPAGNRAAELLVEQLQESFRLLGAELIVDELPMDELLRHYYRQTERTYDLFFLASNFSSIFDPYYTFHTDDAYQGLYNTSGLRDKKLMQLALDMRQASPDDTEAYKEKWMNFQKYFVEVLPLVPLYSNVYYDLYHPMLTNYHISQSSTWGTAIVYASWNETGK